MSSLRGRRIVVTRPADQARSMVAALAACGAVPIPLSVIRIAPPGDTHVLDSQLQALNTFDWLILTSVNGVNAVWARLDALGIRSLPDGLRVAAIGPSTAAAMKARGVQADFVPSEYVAEAILPGLGDLASQRVLLARADIARSALPELIRQHGGEAVETIAYITLPAEADAGGLRALRQGTDIITFTSPSTVHNFAALCVRENLPLTHLPGEPIFAAIGPITAAAIQEHGLPIAVIARVYTAKGLIEALEIHFANEKRIQNTP